MGLKDQMKIAEEYHILEEESKIISEKIHSLAKTITARIKQAQENICQIIKDKILEEGKINNFEVNDSNKTWSMKYKSLEFDGNFHSEIKVIERRNGSKYLKIEFILDSMKPVPKSSYSVNGSFQNQIEQKQKEIEIQNAILRDLNLFNESFSESDLIIKYTLGERSVIRSSIDRNKSTQITISELLNICFE